MKEAPEAASTVGAASRGGRVGSVVVREVLRWRAGLIAAAHAVIFTAVFWAAFCLRFDFSVPAGMVDLLWQSLPWVLAVKLVVFYLTGQFHGWWRYVAFGDLVSLGRAATVSFLAMLAIDHLLLPTQVPRSVMLADFLGTVVVLGGLRATCRATRETLLPFVGGRERPVLLALSDYSDAILAHQIHAAPGLPYRVRGFLATGTVLEKGRRLGNVPVLGTLDDLKRVAKQTGVAEMLVVAGSIPGNRFRRLMAECDAAGLPVKVVPPMADLLSGGRNVPIRDVQISDLLRREPISLDNECVGELLEGRRVLVTGAGGSIGSEICRQILKFRPTELVLLGRGENRIFAIERELAGSGTSVELTPVIASITDRSRMRQVFEEHRPQVVFHAAAHKHVPLMEANVGEAVKNNIFGTKNVAELADEFDAEAFVLVSTDKAVNPTSVMGVTKQLAERFVHCLSQTSATRFMVVRFGNVLGSAGSVVPIFLDQVRRGGPITITDERMTRFFMTIPEASQLVLQAASMGRGGEIFVLDMGDQIRITDLAKDLVRLAGLPEDAIEITFTGLRPGEKLYEELYFDNEQMIETAHPKVKAAYHRAYSPDEVHFGIARLEDSLGEPQAVLRGLLGEIVAEYAGADMSHPAAAFGGPRRAVVAAR